jgi:DNA polymerase-3 subunit delta
MPIRLEQLGARLQAGLAPVYLIGGPEPLLVQECRDQVCAVAREQGFLERELLQVERGFDWEQLEQAGSVASLFTSRKIIDLRMPTGKPGQDGAKALTSWVADPDPDLLLVISCDQWDKGSRNSKWANALDQAGLRIDIWPVGPAELPRWIANRLHARGLEPEREAVMVLADRLEGNLLAAQQEIEKLALLKGGGRVTAEDVLQAVADSSRFDAFLLVERILAGNLADSLRVALGLRRTAVPVQLVTGALCRELRTLEAYRLARQSGEGEAAAFRRLGVWRNRQGPMRSAAARVDATRLNEAFASLSLIDLQSKGQAGGDPWHSLDRLACSLCGA